MDVVFGGRVRHKHFPRLRDVQGDAGPPVELPGEVGEVFGLVFCAPDENNYS